MEIVLVVVSVIILIAALVLTYRTQKKLQQASEQTQAQQEVWEKAQDTRQQQWRTEQEKHLTEIEQHIQAQIHHLQTSWKSLEEFERQQREDLRQAFENSTRQAHAEFELARIPRVEDVPLPVKQDQSGKSTPRGQRVNLSGTDLSQRDLSSRYLGHANLSETILHDAKCFMADFSWANLRDADLANADLSGTNLTHTDLRGANLNGVNFLAADLYKTNLIGANLLNARNLTAEQLRTTVYDDSTLLDIEPKKVQTNQDGGATLTNMRAIRTTKQQPAAPPTSQVTPAVEPPVTPMPSTNNIPDLAIEQPPTSGTESKVDDENAMQWLSYLNTTPSKQLEPLPEVSLAEFDPLSLALLTPIPQEEMEVEKNESIPQGEAFEPATYEEEEQTKEEQPEPVETLVSEAAPYTSPARGILSNTLLPYSLPETEGSGSYVLEGEPSALSPHLSGSSLLDLEDAALPEIEPEQKEVVASASKLSGQPTTEHNQSSESENK
ncbi:pentapeptide repeat-containing protein [Ktedonospora formicarum]|uniref:Pentapeptide repeat-containing protein n=1 Tax=Ktedonospora formicarum TaxID=2778364 RepID=A0A8J3MYV8_9CHLR|nr:pentapeptide repeat-containing protein [Ktedonospora formicarum]GHO50090.1 hypothetical protein KSX_82530 [Ktedonospora formicarum]